MRLSKTTTVLLVPVAALAVACGTATSAPVLPPASRTATFPATAASPAAATAVGAVAVSSEPPGTAERRAAADAKAILSEFVPPPGAVRLAKEPALPSGSPSMGLTSATQADATGYWRASGTATARQDWEKAHISRGFSHQDVIIGPPSWSTLYSLPPVPGVLPQREMNVQFYDVGGGTTVIMAAAMVSWQPPRPAAEAMPASAVAVTITPAGGWSGNPAPATITSVPTVRRLAAYLGTLPVSTVANDVPCPMSLGQVTLTFRAADGQTVAQAYGPGGCGVLTMRVNGKDEPALQPPASFRATIAKIAGLHWRVIS
jgi:hypothetical protein